MKAIAVILREQTVWNVKSSGRTGSIEGAFKLESVRATVVVRDCEGN